MKLYKISKLLKLNDFYALFLFSLFTSSLDSTDGMGCTQCKEAMYRSRLSEKGKVLFRWYLYFRQNYIKFENFFNIFDKTDLFVIMSGLKSWTGESPKSEGRKEIQTMHCRLVEEGRVKVKIDTDKERYYKYIL